MVHESPDREVPADKIGEYLMERLRELDKVAFVRFASVYRNFRDLDEFTHELNELLRTRE
jgi:transcriptional repressor NrdR